MCACACVFDRGTVKCIVDAHHVDVEAFKVGIGNYFRPYVRTRFKDPTNEFNVFTMLLRQDRYFSSECGPFDDSNGNPLSAFRLLVKITGLLPISDKFQSGLIVYYLLTLFRLHMYLYMIICIYIYIYSYLFGRSNALEKVESLGVVRLSTNGSAIDRTTIGGLDVRRGRAGWSVFQIIIT